MRWPSGHREYPKTYALLENWGESYSACIPQARGGGDARIKMGWEEGWW